MENLYNQEQESQTQMVHHIIEKLSHKLKMDIAREANSRLLENMSFFNQFSEECRKNVIYLFQEYRFSPNEIVFQQDQQHGIALYFIERGEGKENENKSRILFYPTSLCDLRERPGRKAEL